MSAKRGAGRNKSAAKKRAYKLHCYSMRTSGFITDENGNWVDSNLNALHLSDAAIRGTTAK